MVIKILCPGLSCLDVVNLIYNNNNSYKSQGSHHDDPVPPVNVLVSLKELQTLKNPVPFFRKKKHFEF